jgi:peptidoglycan/LPS O-acetylase OafA/YrhL
MMEAVRTDPRFDNNIDFLRLLAAVGVVFGHAFVFSGSVDPITRGIARLDLPHMAGTHGFSVWFLFFISGYLVSASYAHRHDVRHYLWSRFLRIYPGLFLVILLTTLCGVIITTLPAGDYFSDKTTWKYFSRNILGFSIKYELPGVFANNHNNAVNGSLWTIPLELRLYLVVMVLGLCGLFKRLYLLAGILLSLILAQVSSDHEGSQNSHA